MATDWLQIKAKPVSQAERIEWARQRVELAARRLAAEPGDSLRLLILRERFRELDRARAAGPLAGIPRPKRRAAR